METTKEEKLNINLIGDEAKHFTAALKKMVDEEKAIGFKKSNLSDDERKVMRDLSDKLSV